MNLQKRKVLSVVMVVVTAMSIAGCASIKETNQKEYVTGQLPRPAHIWVYTFAVTPADLPANSALAGQYSEHRISQTAEHIAAGRKLCDEIETEMVKQLNGMGMPAEHAVRGTTPRINDIIIQGYLISFEKGSAGKRIAIGFGYGSSELRVAVEGFQMTDKGLRNLWSEITVAGGSKTPGAVTGVAGLLATRNPAGLIVSSAIRVFRELSGSSRIEGRAKQTANEIDRELRKRLQGQDRVK